MFSNLRRSKVLWLAVFTALVLALTMPVLLSRAAGGGTQPEGLQLREILRGTFDPQLRTSLEKKIEIQQREEQDRIKALSYAPTKPQDPYTLRPSSIPDAPRQTGILEGVQPPFSAEDVKIANQWQDYVEGQWVQVYAGALSSNPKQGVVIVLIESSKGVTGQRYLTPIQAGTVKIVKADGSYLTLQASTGTRFPFDVQSRRFVSMENK